MEENYGESKSHTLGRRPMNHAKIAIILAIFGKKNSP